MKYRPNRYYVRWVLLSFILTTLPVVLLGLFSYEKSAGVVQEKADKETSLGLQQTQMNVEHSLKVVDQAATHFLGSKIIQTALGEPLRPDQFQLFSQVKSELGGLQRLDTGIMDIQLWSTTGNWFINNDGLYRLDGWLKGNGGRKLPEPAAPSLWEVSRTDDASADGNTGSTDPLDAEAPSRTAAVNSCGVDVHLLKKLPLTAYRSVGAARILIPACSLSNLISVNAEHEAVLLFDESGQLFVHKGVDLEGLEQSLIQSIGHLPEESFGRYKIEAGGKPLSVSYRKSDYNGWVYMSVVTLDQLTRSSREIGWYTLYICIGLLVLFVMIALLGTMRLYRPIGNLYQFILKQTDTPAPSGRMDEVQMIGEHVHTLSDAKKRLESRLEGQSELLRTFMMVKLFLFGLKEEELAERLDSLGLRSDFSRFCVLAVQLGDLAGTRFKEQDTDLLLFAVNNIVRELIAADMRLHPIVLGRTQTMVYTGSHHLDEHAFARDAYAAAQLIRTTVSDVIGLDVLIGISVPYSRLHDVPRAYEEAVEALRRRAALGGESIVCFGDLGENHELHYAYPAALQAELFDAIKLVEREKVGPLLRRLLQHIGVSSANPYDIQFSAARLLMNMLALANAISVQALPMQRQQSLLDELFQLKLPDAGEEWFTTKMIEPIMNEVENQTEMRHLSLSKQLVHMIQSEFDTDLTIDACAERLHYNASYLSTIFRKSMDITFGAYLARHRHHVALKWLNETDMPIKEIAEKLSYNNSQNFIRSFRKTEGISPGKYREMTRQDAPHSEGSAGNGGISDAGH